MNEKGKVHQETEKIECRNGFEIFISYPGKKDMDYDYRVDLKRKNECRESISHPNIILDIYNKVNDGFDKNKMKNFLIEIFNEGEFEQSKFSKISGYEPISPPSQNLLNIAEENHAQDEFNPSGNKWDYTFEELKHIIKWISVQEDLNYPPLMGNRGREMSLYRYIEAIECNDDEQLGKVIERATIKNSIPHLYDSISYPSILLFSLDKSKYEKYLKEGNIDSDLREIFETKIHELSDDAILKEGFGKWWIIIKKDKKEKDWLFKLKRSKYEEFLKEGIIPDELVDVFEDREYILDKNYELSERNWYWWIKENGEKRYKIVEGKNNKLLHIMGDRKAGEIEVEDESLNIYNA